MCCGGWLRAHAEAGIRNNSRLQPAAVTRRCDAGWMSPRVISARLRASCHLAMQHDVCACHVALGPCPTSPHPHPLPHPLRPAGRLCRLWNKLHPVRPRVQHHVQAPAEEDGVKLRRSCGSTAAPAARGLRARLRGAFFFPGLCLCSNTLTLETCSNWQCSPPQLGRCPCFATRSNSFIGALFCARTLLSLLSFPVPGMLPPSGACLMPFRTGRC